MVHIFCKLCQRSVEVNAWKEHISSEKHMNNLPSNIIVKCNIEKDKINSVHEYFAKFGKITRKEVLLTVGKTVKIQYFYEDASAYSTIIHKRHMLFGQSLEIESHKKPMDFTDLRNIVSTSVLKECTFAQQIAVMQDILKNNNSDKEQVLDTIHKGLNIILKPQFPHCQISFFGSKVTGLDIANSKLGVYVDKVKQNNISENQTLQTIKNLISKSVHFDNVLTFVDEELPVIKFRHITTDIMCYLNIKNRLVVKRSQLLKYYLSLDRKVHQFLVTIKFWAKCHAIFKGSSLNYALHLMVIFYLQQEPYNLPSVAELQKNRSPDLEKQWNCAFGPVTFSSSALQKATILELITGFFKFYENFDFFSYVISPYCGYAIEKTRFLPPYQLPECYGLFMLNQRVLHMNYGITVQDPFEHSKNIFYGAPMISGSRFVALCRYSLPLVTSGESQLLSKLLEPNFSEERKFSLEKPKEYTDKDWRRCIKKLTQDIFAKILCCKMTATKIELDEVAYTFAGYQNIWPNRTEILKELEPDLFFCNEFEKEVAVTSRIVKDANQSKPSWSVTIHLKFHSDRVDVFLTLKSKEKKKSVLDHFLRVKMEKFVKEMVTTGSGGSSADLAQFTTLAQTIKTVPTLQKQIVLLQKKWEKNETEIETECKMICDYLKSALSSKFTNQIYFYELSKTALNYPNKVFSIYVDRVKQSLSSELTTLDTIKALLQKSETISEVSVCFGPGSIRFIHKKNQNRCILTLRNQKLMSRSTELIRYYLSLDQKLQPFLHIIELWMNYYKLTDTSFITTYTLHMMVLFYLQQKYEVPSVFDLQKNASALMIGGWNCAIVATQVTNLKLKKATLLELVQGFFTFYTKFDYISYVISPFHGSPIEKTKFLKPCDLPESFKDYTKNMEEIHLNFGFCVQDLFEHSRNLVPPQPLHVFSKFTSFCRRTLHLIEKQGEEFLSDLFSSKVRNYRQLGEYEVEKPEGANLEEWKEETKSLTLKIMKEILTYECTQTSEEGKYECVASYDVLVNRLKVTKNLVFTGDSDFEKEVATTSSICKEYSRKIESLVYMNISFKANPYRMIISFSPKMEDFNLNFTDFFYTKLIKFLPRKDDKFRVNIDGAENVDVIDIESSSPDSNQHPDKEKKLKPSKEDNDEDVPSDFFDDFADDRFLDGLDIVDVWTKKEKTVKRKSRDHSASTERKLSKKGRRRRSHSNSRSRSPVRRKRSTSRTRRRRSLSRSRRSISRSRSRPRRSTSRLRDKARRIRRDKESEERVKNRRLSRSRSRDLKEKRRRSRSRSWSLSRRRSLSPRRSEELEKRLSFLEEIRQKLNEIDSPVVPSPSRPVLPPAAPIRRAVLRSLTSVPLPVPPPNAVIPPVSAIVQTYDQSFFIGSHTPVLKDIPTKPESNFCKDEDISRLYEEKKISLRDFLTIQAKDRAKTLTVEQLLTKTKVITQCQDVIEILSHRKLGRISVPPESNCNNKSGTKYKSPVLRGSTKFKFTNPYKINSEIDPFSDALYKIFQKMGIFKEENRVWKLIDSVAEALSNGAKMDKEIAAQIFQISLLSPLAVNQRKEKVEVGTQCKENISVEVQVKM